MPVKTRERSQDAYQKAWDNKAFVYSKMKFFKGSHYDEAVLFDAGLDALAAAYENYDPARFPSAPFAIYAGRCIQLAMSRARDRDTMIHVPEWTRRLAMRCITGESSLEDIPEKTRQSNDTRGQVRDAIAVLAPQRVSLNASAIDIYKQETAPPSEEPLSDRMQAAIATLLPWERRSINAIFPIDGMAQSESNDLPEARNSALAKMRHYLERN